LPCTNYATGFDGAAVVLDRMRRRAPRADQQALGHDEANAHQRLAGLRKFLLQVPHHADDLVAEHVKPHMLVGSEQRLAGESGQRRVLRQPDAAAGVGERQVHPGPAGVIGEDLRHRVIGDERGRAIGLEMIGPDDTGFRRCGRGIRSAGGAAYGHGALPRSHSFGVRVGAPHMTG
jgi:hypothetical protein